MGLLQIIDPATAEMIQQANAGGEGGLDPTTIGVLTPGMLLLYFVYNEINKRRNGNNGNPQAATIPQHQFELQLLQTQTEMVATLKNIDRSLVRIENKLDRSAV